MVGCVFARCTFSASYTNLILYRLNVHLTRPLPIRCPETPFVIRTRFKCHGTALPLDLSRSRQKQCVCQQSRNDRCATERFCGSHIVYKIKPSATPEWSHKWQSVCHTQTLHIMKLVIVRTSTWMVSKTERMVVDLTWLVKCRLHTSPGAPSIWLPVCISIRHSVWLWVYIPSLLVCHLLFHWTIAS